jgi:hypothetical protein
VQSAGGAVTFKLHPSSVPVVYYNLGTRPSGTEVLSRVNGDYQFYTSTGSHALAPQTGHGEIIVEITLSATSTITTAGYTRTTGAFTTTSGHKFLCRSNRTPNYTSLEIVPLQ